MLKVFAKMLLVGGTAVALGVAGCGGDDDDDGDDGNGGDTTFSNVTFTVDTTGTADGTNALATVEDGESVYLVGDFGAPDPAGGTAPVPCWTTGATPDSPCWTPVAPELEMTASGSGIYTITIPVRRGHNVEFKFAKSPSERCLTTNSCTDIEDCRDACQWSNGEKVFITDADSDWPTAGCEAHPTETQGLYEVPNRTFTVPDAETATVPEATVEAWRDYAEDLGSYLSC